MVIWLETRERIDGKVGADDGKRLAASINFRLYFLGTFYGPYLYGELFTTRAHLTVDFFIHESIS